MEISLSKMVAILSAYTEESPLNTVPELGMLKLYETPLVGIADADDPLFLELTKEEVVGPHHMTPKEWLEGAGSVISYFLPFTEEVRKANRMKGAVAKEWLYGRIEGEIFNNSLRKYLVGYFLNQGIQAIAPGLDKRFKIVDRRSNWSERHAAFIAGLGTFSLSRSLITEKGSAGRLGSVIVDFKMEPTKRPYQEVDEYCTKCGACILRCPPLAINERGKDNTVCSEYLDRVLAHFHPRYGCGKCQTGVPCECRIP